MCPSAWWNLFEAWQFTRITLRWLLCVPCDVALGSAAKPVLCSAPRLEWRWRMTRAPLLFKTGERTRRFCSRGGGCCCLFVCLFPTTLSAVRPQISPAGVQHLQQDAGADAHVPVHVSDLHVPGTRINAGCGGVVGAPPRRSGSGSQMCLQRGAAALGTCCCANTDQWAARALWK